MQFTLRFGQQLAKNHNLEFRKLSIDYSSDGTNNFEMIVRHPDSKFTWKFISEYQKDQTRLRLDLDNYVSLATVNKDTQKGWNDAAMIVLSDSRVKRWLEHDGKPQTFFKKTLLEQLERHGKVTKSESRYRLKGFGEISIVGWNMTNTLHVTRISTEGKKTYDLHLLDEWEPILQEAIAFLTETKTDEVGYTTLQEYLQDCQECPVATEVDYDYDEGDDRTYGMLSVGAKLPFGTLRWNNLAIGSSGGIEEGYDEKLLLDDTELDKCELPNIDVPHYYNGNKAISRWEQSASDSLLDDFNEWLSERWAEFKQV